MKPEQASQIIVEAIHIAISKGSYGLVEVTNIVKALELLFPAPEQAVETPTKSLPLKG